MSNLRSYLLILCIIVMKPILASPVDSLLTELTNAQSDSARSYIYVMLAKNIYRSDMARAKDYCEQAIEAAKKSNQLISQADANNIIGAYYENKGEYFLADNYFHEGLKVARQAGDSLIVSKILNNLGLVYKNTGQYEKAVTYYILSQKIAEEFGKPSDVAVAYINLAVVYKLTGDGDYSRKYTRLAYGIYLDKKDSIGMAAALNNLGINFKEDQQYDSALHYLRQSLVIKEKINFVKGMVTGLYSIGEVYKEVGLLNESLEYFKRSLELAEKHDLRRHIAKCYDLMGDTYMALNNTRQAIDSYLMSLEINSELGVRQGMLDNYLDLNTAYIKVGNINKAYLYQSKLIAMKDSIFDNHMAETVAKLKFQFDIDAKNKEIETLKSREERSKLEKERSELIYYFVGTVVFLLFLLAVSFYRSSKGQKKYIKEINRQKREIEKAHDIIKEKNDQLTIKNVDLEIEVDRRTDELNNLLNEFDLFVYKSAHDLRNPVAQILGIYNLLKVDKDNPELLGKLKQTAELMDKLLSKLSDIHILRNKVIEPDWIVIENMVRDLLERHEAENPLTNLRVSVNNNDHIKFKSDVEMVSALLDELLTNSIEFRNRNKKNLTIDIQTELSAEGVRIIFSDNGSGINLEHQKNIFEMFYRANEISHGHGLGLYKALIIVRRLNGSINLTKSDQNGTQFEIIIASETKRNNKVTEIDQF